MSEIKPNQRLPGATYRIQFHAGFTLRDALAIVPYLHSLGVTHLYASPLLKAYPGSTHGYDVTDHSQLNPEIGTENDLADLASALRERGMGIIHDAVPNHMCVRGDNPWWWDVLEHGPASPFAGHFDIAWFDSPQPQMHGRLLLPVLGEQYGAVLEAGQLVPALEDGDIIIRYYEGRFPVDTRTYGLILSPAVESVRFRLGPDHADSVELASIVNAVRHLPPRSETDPQQIDEVRAECASIRRRLKELPERFPGAAEALDEAIATLAGKPGEPASFSALDALLEAQAYRLAFWRVASDEINYRRFFDINELAALSTEREDVFRAVHATWFRWIAAGCGDGLRIDHPDGLFDPKQYLERLQEMYRETVPGANAELYVVVEKILGDGERLPADWACAGTTGYEFINAVNGLFIDPAGESALTAFYQRFTNQDDTWSDLVYHKKRRVMHSSLSSELNALAHQLYRLARLDRRSRDFTLIGLGKALREVIACFPVYRSYISTEPGDTDKESVGKATRWAYRRNSPLGRAIFNFIRDTVLLKDSPSGPSSDAYRQLQRNFAGKFQQVTSPVTAKGVEDTAFYVYNRLVSLNEVGGEPGRFGWKPEALHEFLTRRAAAPGGLSPLASHDTKRGEDVRARINVLSERPAEWSERVDRWAEWNQTHKVEIEGMLAPDPNAEYLLYQTLVGTYPDDGAIGPDYVSRIQQYMKKALAEAKVHTSWINPDLEYEAAVATFIERILSTESAGEFLADLGDFAQRIVHFGHINSLAQTLLRCTAPGVPDTYQGTEEWDLSLVDPDNRRPVDYAGRVARLKELDALSDVTRIAALARNLADPRAKMLVVSRALRARRQHPQLFSSGDYIPLTADGTRATNVFGFLRTCGTCGTIVIVPRLLAGNLPPGAVPIGSDFWQETSVQLPEGTAGGKWLNVITGEWVELGGTRVEIATVLSNFPVALLVRAE